MPVSPSTTQPDDMFREVDPAKQKAPTKRSVLRTIQTPPSSQPKPLNQPPALSNRKKYLIIIGFGVVLFALGLGAYFWLTRAKTDTAKGSTNTNQPVANNAADTNITNQAKNENVNTANLNANVPATNSTIVPADTDRDGLSDEDERKLGTDPSSSDTDKDGLSDKQEVVLYKSDPKKADTDGDGISDGDEVKNGYNPIGGGKLLDINKAINSGL